MAAISLRYKIADELENTQELLFVPKVSTQFNHIKQNTDGSLLEDYAGMKAIPSSLLGNRCVLMGGVGWFAKLEFPYLNDLLSHGEWVGIEQAILKIYPEPKTYSSFNILPDSVFLYIADENNVVTDAVKDYLGEQVQGGVLVKDDTFDEKTYYYFDVTDFMQQELGALGMYKHNLQLVFNGDTYTGSIKNMTFSDQNGQSPVVLQLTYKIYESY